MPTFFQDFEYILEILTNFRTEIKFVIKGPRNKIYYILITNMSNTCFKKSL